MKKQELLKIGAALLYKPSVQALKRHLKGKSHIIWDWNGTLLDDVDLVLNILNDLRKEHGLPQVNRQQYREAFGFPIKEYYRKVGFDLDKISYDALSVKFHDAYRKGVQSCNLHPGTRELLTEIRESNLRQSVLSASHEPNLIAQLDLFQLRPYFDHVYGLPDQHAASKVERGKELLKVAQASSSETILIGDTDHDLEVGKALNIEVLLVADGHQSYERLKPLHHRVLESRTNSRG